MSLSSFEQKTLQTIEQWEQTEFTYETTDFTALYDQWFQKAVKRIRPKWRNQILKGIDQSIFHLNAVLQGSHYQKEARETILTEARIFDESIDTIEEMRKLSLSQLEYIFERQMSRQKLLAFAHGGLTGTGGLLLLGADFPLLLMINMRAIQITSMIYGYEMNLPRETMTILKVLHVGMLPSRLKAQAWYDLQEETFHEQHDPYFYTGRDDLEDDSWFEQGIRQILKCMVVSQLKKKLLNGIPLIGIAFGAGVNYNLTRQVIELSHRFYQKRYLQDKLGEGL